MICCKCGRYVAHTLQGTCDSCRKAELQAVGLCCECGRSAVGTVPSFDFNADTTTWRDYCRECWPDERSNRLYFGELTEQDKRELT